MSYSNNAQTPPGARNPGSTSQPPTPRASEAFSNRSSGGERPRQDPGQAPDRDQTPASAEGSRHSSETDDLHAEDRSGDSDTLADLIKQIPVLKERLEPLQAIPGRLIALRAELGDLRRQLSAGHKELASKVDDTADCLMADNKELQADLDKRINPLSERLERLASQNKYLSLTSEVLAKHATDGTKAIGQLVAEQGKAYDVLIAIANRLGGSQKEEPERSSRADNRSPALGPEPGNRDASPGRNQGPRDEPAVAEDPPKGGGQELDIQRELDNLTILLARQREDSLRLTEESRLQQREALREATDELRDEPSRTLCEEMRSLTRELKGALTANHPAGRAEHEARRSSSMPVTSPLGSRAARDPFAPQRRETPATSRYATPAATAYEEPYYRTPAVFHHAPQRTYFGSVPLATPYARAASAPRAAPANRFQRADPSHYATPSRPAGQGPYQTPHFAEDELVDDGVDLPGSFPHTAAASAARPDFGDFKVGSADWPKWDGSIEYPQNHRWSIQATDHLAAMKRIPDEVIVMKLNTNLTGVAAQFLQSQRPLLPTPGAWNGNGGWKQAIVDWIESRTWRRHMGSDLMKLSFPASVPDGVVDKAGWFIDRLIWYYTAMEPELTVLGLQRTLETKVPPQILATMGIEERLMNPAGAQEPREVILAFKRAAEGYQPRDRRDTLRGANRRGSSGSESGSEKPSFRPSRAGNSQRTTSYNTRSNAKPTVPTMDGSTGRSASPGGNNPAQRPPTPKHTSCYRCGGPHFARNCDQKDGSHVGGVSSEEPRQDQGYEQDAFSDEEEQFHDLDGLITEEDKPTQVGYVASQEASVSTAEAMACKNSEASLRVRAVPDADGDSSFRPGRPLRLQGMLMGRPASVVLGSGAMPSIVTATFLRGFDSKFEQRLQPAAVRNTRGFHGTTKVLGHYLTDLMLPHPDGNLVLLVSFLVLDEARAPYPILLGEDTLRRYAVNVIRSTDPNKPAMVKVGSHRQRFLVHNEPVSRDEGQEPAVAAERIHPPCRAAHEGLSYVRFVQMLNDPPARADKDFCAALDEVDINPALPEPAKADVRKILRACQGALALPEHDYPYGQIGDPVDLRVTHPWPMPKGLKKSRYPLSARARVDVKAQVDRQLKASLIRRSRSPYSAPTFCTYRGKKPRPVHDYREINEYVETPAYPLPNMPKLIRSLRGARYMSSIDIMDAFFCLKLTDGSRKYTAFVTEDGLFEYNVGSFGLACMPAEFQSRIEELFREAVDDGWLKAYIDDLLLTAGDWHEHAWQLYAVFFALQRQGVRTKTTKLHLGYGELTWLGHKLNGLSLALDENRIAVVRDWPRPKDVPAVRRFIGFVG